MIATNVAIQSAAFLGNKLLSGIMHDEDLSDALHPISSDAGHILTCTIGIYAPIFNAILIRLIVISKPSLRTGC